MKSAVHKTVGDHFLPIMWIFDSLQSGGDIQTVTWIFMVDAFRLWAVPIEGLFTASRLPGNHLIIGGIPTVPLCINE